MLVDFRDAADRHWDDAGDLFGNLRLANADHLFGLSAECALKAVMLALGMKLGSGGAPTKQQHREHVNRLWDKFVSFANNRGGARYAGALLTSPNPFHDWDVSQRYEHRSRFTQAAVKKHQKAADSAMRALQRAVLDGVIP